MPSCTRRRTWSGSLSDDEHVRLSKFLGLVLRHTPQLVGITLDAHGWVEIEELLERCARHGTPIALDVMREIVVTNPKKRFAISDDGARIRASQGHTVPVDLAYEASAPPDLLFHGTYPRALPLIRAQGLSRIKRHHVHLSIDEETARTVATRRGTPIVLRIDAAAMHADGRVFYLSANGVWLTEEVPVAYIAFPRP